MTINRTQAPEIYDLNLPLLRNPQIISNGIYAFLKDSMDVFRLDIIFPKAGAGNSSFAKSNIMVGEMLMSGTSKMNAQELNEKLDFYGSYTNISTTYYKTTLTVYGLSKYFEEILELIAEAVNNSNFPEKELEILKQQKVNKLSINKQKTEYQSSLLINKFWYGENSILGRETKDEDYLEISREILIEDFSKNFDEFFILLSGNNELKTFTDKINNLFKQKIKDSTFSVKADIDYVKTQTSDSEAFYEIEKANQASFNARLEVNPRQSADYVHIAFLNLILGGYFGSRLMKNIREEKGWTYGISSRIINHQNRAFLHIGGSIQKDKAIAVREEIKKEFEKLKTELISSEELEIAKNYYLGNLQALFNEFMGLNDRHLSLLETGENIEWYNKFGEELKRITAEQIKETANNYLQSKSLIYSWSGPTL